MKPVSPIVKGCEDHEIRIAENQDEYETLPALPVDHGQRILTRWSLTWRERLTLLFKGNVYLHVWTFGRPIQPLYMEVDELRQQLDELKRSGTRPQARPTMQLAANGRTCRTCRHATRISYFYKCGLAQDKWTGSRNTDIRLKDPACAKYEER
ncbi:MAG: hypothetical protein IPM50_02795 [Acidobacteriota bacterium]|nr:MAG: hypothetical protein IPM50_02795 [Acidobacteriota bacterium]